jgi:hypothetical protein
MGQLVDAGRARCGVRRTDVGIIDEVSTLGHLIDGRIVRNDALFQIVSPSSGEIVAMSTADLALHKGFSEKERKCRQHPQSG